MGGDVADAPAADGGSIGIGYAIPSNTVKTVADGLIAGA